MPSLADESTSVNSKPSLDAMTWSVQPVAPVDDRHQPQCRGETGPPDHALQRRPPQVPRALRGSRSERLSRALAGLGTTQIEPACTAGYRHSRERAREEIGSRQEGEYSCRPGEGRDPCFRCSELFKQLQCLIQRSLVRAAERWNPDPAPG